MKTVIKIFSLLTILGFSANAYSVDCRGTIKTIWADHPQCDRIMFRVDLGGSAAMMCTGSESSDKVVLLAFASETTVSARYNQYSQCSQITAGSSGKFPVPDDIATWK